MLLDISKITEIFLTSSTILVGALGVARTEPLKTGISLIGLIVAALWFICANDALRNPIPPGPQPRRAHVLGWLPVLFFVCWFVSAAVHVDRWRTGASEQPAVSSGSGVPPVAPPAGTGSRKIRD